MPRAVKNLFADSLTAESEPQMKKQDSRVVDVEKRDRIDEYLRLARRSIMNVLPDKWHTALRYRRVFGEFPDLKNPRTFNEKICYRKINPQPIYSVLSDKIAARDYVAHTIGEQYLVPCYAIESEPTPATYSALPESFVMKANHGFGYNLLVRDKADHPFPQIYNLGQHWLGQDFYDVCREAHYRQIKPRLIFEKLLLDDLGNIPKDFKFHCFQREGEEPVVFIEVTHDRFTNYKVDFYNQDWELVEIRRPEVSTGQAMPRPQQLDEALELALKLANGFSYVRVDFYLVGDAIYFGEMTFTPTAGLTKFKDRETDHRWGNLFDI